MTILGQGGARHIGQGEKEERRVRFWRHILKHGHTCSMFVHTSLESSSYAILARRSSLMVAMLYALRSVSLSCQSVWALDA